MSIILLQWQQQKRPVSLIKIADEQRQGHPCEHWFAYLVLFIRYNKEVLCGLKILLERSIGLATAFFCGTMEAWFSYFFFKRHLFLHQLG